MNLKEVTLKFENFEENPNLWLSGSDFLAIPGIFKKFLSRLPVSFSETVGLDYV